MGTPDLPVVLIVEDSADLVEIYKELIGDRAEVLVGSTQEEARTIFVRLTNLLHFIIMDGHVPIAPKIPGTHKDNITLGLIKYIVVSGYKGSVIAATGDPELESQMISAGCDWACSKLDMASLFDELL
jgi:hypothetical protein